MHFSFDAPLDLSKQYSWQKPHTPNMTGTKYAYRYHSSIDKVNRKSIIITKVGSQSKDEKYEIVL